MSWVPVLSREESQHKREAQVRYSEVRDEEFGVPLSQRVLEVGKILNVQHIILSAYGVGVCEESWCGRRWEAVGEGLFPWSAE